MRPIFFIGTVGLYKSVPGRIHSATPFNFLQLMKIYKTPLLLFVIIFLTACDGFLDEKPNKSILVPETVADFEAIIDNYDNINITPILPFMLSDDYWTTGSNWQISNLGSKMHINGLMTPTFLRTLPLIFQLCTKRSFQPMLYWTRLPRIRIGQRPI